jgi:large repetitive protein
MRSGFCRAPFSADNDEGPMHALRRNPHRVMAVVMVLAVAVAMTFYVQRADAAITTPFASVFGTEANGAILMRGNANLVCPSGATGCTAAQGGSGSPSDESLNNNGYAMVNTGADAPNGIFNSSSATITMPTNSTVLFAGLYWGATLTAGTDGTAATTAADNNKVKIKLPGGTTWSTVPATRVDTSGSAYQGYADVTSTIAGAGNGSYAVGNIQAGTGKDRYAGWALVIAYRNASLPMRDLRVYNGFGVVSSGSSSVDIAVNGFETPSSGAVTTKIGTVVYEGDLGKTGDALKLNGTAMSDALNPADNFFNSTITEGGTAITDRTPNYSNTMGLDVDQFDASGKLANNATSATLTLTTAGEVFYPGVVTFTTDLYAPDLTSTLTSTDVNGGTLQPGDYIDYEIVVKNNGNDASINTVLTDAVPAGTTYVPGSLKIDGVSKSDATGDDTADFATDTAQGKTTFRLGTGATATSGGGLAANATTTVTYRVQVNDATAGGTAITNVAGLTYTANHNGRNITGTSNTGSTTVAQPSTDLQAGLTLSPTTAQRNGGTSPVTYTMTVKNNGSDREPLPVAKLTLPAGVSVPTPPATCTKSGQDVTCKLAALASGTTGTVVLNAVVADAAATSSVATATASGSGTDPAPGNNTATATLRVNSAPTAVNDSKDTATDTAVTISVLTNDSDPDAGDTLTPSVTVQPDHGSAVANGDGTITYTPASGWSGTDRFTYLISDGRGGTASATVTVNVDNAPPVAHDDSVATAGNTPVTFDPRTNDRDANGDAMTVTAAGQPGAGQGSTTFTATSVTYTPAAGFRGKASFTYTISDGRGGTSTATVDVIVSNQTPAASDDIATTPYRTDVPIDVLANDTDPNNDPLTVSAVDSPTAHGTATISGNKVVYSPAAGFSGTDTFNYTISDGNGGTATAKITVTVQNAPPATGAVTVSTPYGTDAVIDVITPASDPNTGDDLTVTGVTKPAHGTVTVSADKKTLTYSGDPKYSGPDPFTYTISDGNGGTATGTVNLTVQNAAPVVRPDDVTAQANVPLTIPVLANDTDPNDDPMTVVIDSAPAHGTAVVNPDGTVLYTPAVGYLGTDSFHYTAGDGKGGSGGATVTLTVVNSAPVAAADAASTATDTPKTITVLANDSDPNGDALTISAFTNGGHGSVVQSGGNLVYTPAAGFYGTDTFTYTIKDPAGLTSTATVTVTVLNANPIAVADSVVAQPGTPVGIKVLDNDTDPNLGQVLKVLLVTTPGKGKAVVSADGKTVTYTANPGATGTDTFDYVVADDAGGTDTGSVTITLRTLPTAAPDKATGASGQAVTADVTANDKDADGKAVTLTSVNKPAHGTAKVVDGKVVYTPDPGFAGTETITYVVTDSLGGTATGTLTVDVANAAPVANPDQAAAVKNAKVTVDVLANDTDVNTAQTLSVASVGAPAHGTAVIGSDGKIVYTPAKGWTGTDTFTYVVSDGNGGTATGTVTVTTTDSAPVALPDSRETPYQKAITVNVLGNDMDPNGDTLTITGVTQPAHGTVTFTGTGVRFVPEDGWSGTASFTYTITDGTTPATATVTIKVGEAPQVPDKSATAKPDSPVTIGLPKVDENNKAITVTKIGKPKHGHAKLNTDGTVTYVPEDGFAGADSFTYSAIDENGNLATGTIKVMVAGTTKLTATPDKATVSAGKSVVIRVRANDSGATKITKVGKPAHGNAVINKNGTITYAPDDSYAGGTDSFTYTVTDGNGATATGTVTVTVNKASGGTGTSKLPKTGDDIMSVGAVGILTLLVGAALFWFGGRTPAWLLIGAGDRERGPGRHRPGKHSEHDARRG